MSKRRRGLGDPMTSQHLKRLELGTTTVFETVILALTEGSEAP